MVMKGMITRKRRRRSLQWDLYRVFERFGLWVFSGVTALHLVHWVFISFLVFFFLSKKLLLLKFWLYSVMGFWTEHFYMFLWAPVGIWEYSRWWFFQFLLCLVGFCLFVVFFFSCGEFIKLGDGQLYKVGCFFNDAFSFQFHVFATDFSRKILLGCWWLKPELHIGEKNWMCVENKTYFSTMQMSLVRGARDGWRAMYLGAFFLWGCLHCSISAGRNTFSKDWAFSHDLKALGSTTFKTTQGRRRKALESKIRYVSLSLLQGMGFCIFCGSVSLERWIHNPYPLLWAWMFPPTE